MPLPTPRSGETESDFVSRCMGDDTMKKEFDDQKQRAAVCYSQYKQKKESKMYDFRDLVESTQSIIGEKVGEYSIYHNSYTEAINEIVDHVERNGFTVSEDDMFHIVGTGPRKPSSGKTNFIEIPLYKNNRESNRKIIAQVYNTGSKFELNMYFGQAKPSDFREEVESITEAKSSEIKKWFAAKGVSGKVRTIGTKYIEFRVPAAQTIPNEIRLQVIDTVMPNANVSNRNNVNYGNVKDTYIALSPAQWDQVLSLKEGWSVEELEESTQTNLKSNTWYEVTRPFKIFTLTHYKESSATYGTSRIMEPVWTEVNAYKGSMIANLSDGTYHAIPETKTLYQMVTEKPRFSPLDKNQKFVARVDLKNVQEIPQDESRIYSSKFKEHKPGKM